MLLSKGCGEEFYEFCRQRGEQTFQFWRKCNPKDHEKQQPFDIMRAKGLLERDIMLGQVAEHRRQGKPPMCWLDSIKEATGLRLEVLQETVQDRKKWHMLVEEKTQNRESTNVK